MESISDLLKRSGPDDQPVLAHGSQNSQAVECGLGKSIKKAWKKHKVAILIGAAIVVVVVVVIVVTVSTASTGTGAAAAAGCAAFDALINDNKADQGPSNFAPEPSSSPLVSPQKEPPLNKPQSITERWEGLKNSPYFQDIEPPRSSSILSEPFSPPQFIRPEAGPIPNSTSFEKPQNSHSQPRPSSHESSVYSVRRETWYQEFIKEEQNPMRETFEFHGFSTESPKEQYPPLFQQPLAPSSEPYDPNRPLTFAEWWNQFIATEENEMKPLLDDRFSYAHGRPYPIDPNPACMQAGPFDGFNSLFEDKMPSNSVSSNLRSHRLTTLGPVNKDMLIMAINGINTSLEEALSHQAYLKNFLPEHVGMDFIYNHSNSVGVDVAEVFSFNYLGYSPNTATLLRETWQEFHDHHRDNPNKKILVIAHSQGTIHVANALNGCPKEMTDRLIIISIGPATVISENACYHYEAYASKNDFVHLGQLVQPGFFNHSETGTSKWIEMILEARENLTFLDPHPDAEKFDHGLQSPTFKKPLSNTVNSYINKNGEYE